MRRGEGRGVVAEGLGRCGGVGEKDEGGVCLPVKKTRRRRGGGGAGVKYCAGRTTDPNTAFKSQERRGNKPQESPPEERERAP